MKNKIVPQLNPDSLPIFCPDATRGVLRSLDTQDILQTKTHSLIVNTLHLMEKPGANYLRQIGGIKKFMNWPTNINTNSKIISDSGGFQLFSLFHQNPNKGQITDQGLKIYTGPKRQKYDLFTPEKSIQVQFAIGSDIKVCLDDFTPIDADEDRVERSVKRTIDWATRSKQEFTKQLQLDQPSHPHLTQNPPQLFAVIQGHQNRYWRKYCADALLEIGFDGFGLGGWLFNADKTIDYETMRFNASLTPNPFPRYAMGFGKPEDVVEIYQMGYTIFDCVLPTRDARHGRIYAFTPHFRQLLAQNEPEQIKTALQNHNFYHFLYLDKASPSQKLTPLDEHCSCHTCQNYSQSYLHHLFKIPDTNAARLATIHNLFFYQELMSLLPQFLSPKI